MAEQDESRCHSENTDAKRRKDANDSSDRERGKKKKRKHESGGISDDFASTGDTFVNVKGRGGDVETKREGRKKRKVEQDIDREEELEKPVKKNKKSRLEEGSNAVHLTGKDSKDGVTGKKYEEETSAHGDDYDMGSKSKVFKSKKRKKEHKQNPADDRRAVLEEGQGIIEVCQKKENSRQGEGEGTTNQLDLGYRDKSKEEKMNKQQKKEEKSKQKKGEEDKEEKINKLHNKEKKDKQKKEGEEEEGEDEEDKEEKINKLHKKEKKDKQKEEGEEEEEEDKEDKEEKINKLKKKEKKNKQEKTEEYKEEKVNKQQKKDKKNKQKKDNEVEEKKKIKKDRPAKESARKVRFADNVEVFTSSDGPSKGNVKEKDQLVRGKRFSPEEDELVKEAVYKFIEYHNLGENGLSMVLHCKEHAEIRNCWKEIGAALPWRPFTSVYYRAHILFERSETRSWTEEERELVRKFQEEHGSDWRTLADAMGKHRVHVKDTWRRIKLPNMKKGPWTQEEYQILFDLVNMDLQMKAVEEKVSNHRNLRDNISWEAISQKLSTRPNCSCCLKWYDQLTSPLVAEGLWDDADDYRLLDALVGLDACSMEEVDWDCLIENRSGDICRKRWAQMVKHIGEHGKKSFVEQVEILSERYCPDLIEVREACDRKRLED